MKNLIFTGAVFSLICSVGAAVTDGKDAKEIIKNVKEKYNKVESLQADFEQIFSWELAGETQKVDGTLYLNANNHYRIETETQVIVTDGTNVWTYSKGDNQVIIDLLRQSEENPLPKDLLFKYSEEYKPHYVGEETVGGKKTYLLNLIPKEEDALITSMKIWVDASDWYTIKIEQTDINENVNTYQISNIRENISLEPSLFKFQIPEEAEVVDLR